MSLYEAAKDALKVAQKADNVELIQKLLDVQQMALDMQEKQLKLNSRIIDLEKENAALQEAKKFVFAKGRTYMIDPEEPERTLCPVCTMENKFAFPLIQDNNWCSACKRHYS
jgi:hypothetical protein